MQSLLNAGREWLAWICSELYLMLINTLLSSLTRCFAGSELNVLRLLIKTRWQLWEVNYNLESRLDACIVVTGGAQNRKQPPRKTSEILGRDISELFCQSAVLQFAQTQPVLWLFGSLAISLHRSSEKQLPPVSVQGALPSLPLLLEEKVRVYWDQSLPRLLSQHDLESTAMLVTPLGCV